jgi:superfamily II DNA or RNA helicase
MPPDRRQKRKKKRKEKQKARSQRRERSLRQARADELAWIAREAYRSGHYRHALTWATRALTIDPEDRLTRDIAIRCAKALPEEKTLYLLLRQAWEGEGLSRTEDWFLLGRLALSRQDYRLAEEVLRALVVELERSGQRFPKAKRKELDRLVAICEAMKDRAVQTEGVSKPIPSPPAPEEKPSPVLVAPQVSPASESGRGGRTSPAQAASQPLEPVITFGVDAEQLLRAIREQRRADLSTLDLTLWAYRLACRVSFDQLICLPTLRDVQSLWYQEETARKVMKTFRGRAILADEVGLGKTVEAGIILKEYLLRGLVRTALILTPSSLINQWEEELREKFGLDFLSTNSPLFRQDPERFWSQPFILASIQTARGKRHFEAVTSRAYDLLIVDEAHHLKSRTTSNWTLVNSIQKTFFLMLTATPVQNNLEELYNLVTLLRPGHLKTRKAFMGEFVSRGNPTDPQNRETLRQLLKEVMVRSTRSLTKVRLPPRFAFTTRVSPTSIEDSFYRAITEFVTSQARRPSDGLSKLSLRRLLEAAGSSVPAAIRMLVRMGAEAAGEIGRQARELVEMGRNDGEGAKIRRVVELLRASREQKIIFVNYLATLEYLHEVLCAQAIPHAVFQGSLPAAQKQAAMDAFRDGCPVLLATGIGGEGHNMQFCHMMINYDLPWNPMQIEQRIGRIHRIGQEKEVQVYNFCLGGSLEDHILEVLDRKINMFELVVGEIDMILGRLPGEQEFSDMVYEIWIRHSDETERRRAFDSLAARLKRARTAYEKSKELDEKLFQEDFAV